MSDVERSGTGRGDEAVGRLVRQAYACTVDVDTAARHLWRLHQEAHHGPAQRLGRTLVSALAATVVVAVSASAVALSAGTLPGDTLYPVKRGAERLHLLVSFAPDSDARLHLTLARTRLDEAEAVASSRPQVATGLLGEAVAAIGAAGSTGGGEVAGDVELVRAEALAALAGLADRADAGTMVALDALAAELAGVAVAGLDGADGATGAEGDGSTGVNVDGGAGGSPAPDGVAASPGGPGEERALADTAEEAGAGADAAGAGEQGAPLPDVLHDQDHVAGGEGEPGDPPASGSAREPTAGDGAAERPAPAPAPADDAAVAVKYRPGLERLETLLPEP